MHFNGNVHSAHVHSACDKICNQDYKIQKPHKTTTKYDIHKDLIQNNTYPNNFCKEINYLKQFNLQKS